MGSEFAYEDISSQEVEKYKYKFIKDDKYEGRAVFVVEQYPQYKKSGYTKQVALIDKVMYQPLKIEFYDRKRSLLKTLTQHDYKKHYAFFNSHNKYHISIGVLAVWRWLIIKRVKVLRYFGHLINLRMVLKSETSTVIA